MFQNVIGFICCFKYYFCVHHTLQIRWINRRVFFTGRICQVMERHKCRSSTCCTNSKFLILCIAFFFFGGGEGIAFSEFVVCTKLLISFLLSSLTSRWESTYLAMTFSEIGLRNLLPRMFQL